MGGPDDSGVPERFPSSRLSEDIRAVHSGAYVQDLLPGKTSLRWWIERKWAFSIGRRHERALFRRVK